MALIGLLVAIPALLYFLSPLWRRAESDGGGPAFADAGPFAEIPPNEWRLLSLEVVQQDGWKKTKVKHSIWVRRQGEGSQAVTVLSPICPHLGCPINWHPDRSQFFCPCHGGTFDAAGGKTGGPPPRAMDPLEYEVRGGRLWVKWRDFKIGVAERIPVTV
jgi:Rieske Fe-S protein